MESNEYLDIPRYVPSQVEPDEMDWDAYADHYDLMCELNPSYQENLSTLADFVQRWDLASNSSVCDLGAGTGNYIKLLSGMLPDASFTHVDFDKKMNDVARRKYKVDGVEDVRIIREYAQRIVFPENRFDLILCINALYAIPPQERILKQIYRWLKPGGRFFVIDFGRKQRVLDWTFYLFRESLKNRRVGTYVKALVEGREVIRQNHRSTKGQITGRYWTHSTADFGDTLRRCGFDVEDLYPCYRGYSDLAVCLKP